jgi:hypothetical protein
LETLKVKDESRPLEIQAWIPEDFNLEI